MSGPDVWSLLLLLVSVNSPTQIPDRAAPPSLSVIDSLVVAGSYAQAVAGARALLSSTEAAYGSESLETADVLDRLVDALHESGKSSEAGVREAAERAVRIREQRLDPDPHSLSTSLINLGFVLRDLGDLSGARAAMERAVALREKALGSEHPDVAKALNNLAMVLASAGDFEGARQLYGRSLAIQEKTLGPDDPALGYVLHNLGHVLEEMGDFKGARPLYERSLALQEKGSGPDHPDVGRVLSALGVLCIKSGDYDVARHALERALAIEEKASGPDGPDVAGYLNNLAILYEYLGDNAAARPLYERALAIHEKTLGPDHRDLAMSLDNLAILNARMGDYAAARPLFERAREMRERLFGPEHPEVASSLANSANLLELTGDPEGARVLYRRAEEIFEKALGRDCPVVAAIMDNLGRVSVELQDYQDARGDYERALAVKETVFGPNHPGVASSLSSLAALLVVLGERDEALELTLRAEEIGREHLRLMARFLSEREALNYASVRSSGRDLALSLCAASSDPSDFSKVWDCVLRSRALVLDEMSWRHRSTTMSADPEFAVVQEQLTAARTELSELVIANLQSGGETPDYRAKYEEARRRKEDAERKLAALSARFESVLRQEQAGLSDIRAAMPQGSALLSYYLYNETRYPGEAARGSTFSAVPSYVAFILPPDGEPSVVSLGPAAPIDSLTGLWRREMAAGLAVGGGSADTDRRCQLCGDALRRAIWDPLSKHLGNPQLLFIVPDGAVNLVSFAGLPAPDGSYLIESGPMIHYLSAERDLILAPAGEATSDGLLAVCDPDYDRAESSSTGFEDTSAAGAVYRGRTPDCADFEDLRFERLRETAEEGRAVERLWRRYLPKSPAQVLSRVQASEGRVKREAHGKRVLHLATHGFFLGEGCPSALRAGRGVGALASLYGEAGESGQAAPAGVEAASGQEASSGSQAPPPVALENPLVLSGLAFAGGNRRGAVSSNADDGILTAEEVAALDLADTQWAVLSACGTSLGSVQVGEGIFGLRRAFQVAGVRTLITSLWSVEDKATRDWMESLYEARLKNGQTVAGAVRQASLHMLEESRRRGESTHPSRWAAFVASGDWR